MANGQVLRQVVIRPGSEGGWWVVMVGIGTDGSRFEYTCCDRHEPFRDRQAANDAARWVASHFRNDDGSEIDVMEHQ